MESAGLCPGSDLLVEIEVRLEDLRHELLLLLEVIITGGQPLHVTILRGDSRIPPDNALLDELQLALLSIEEPRELLEPPLQDVHLVCLSGIGRRQGDRSILRRGPAGLGRGQSEAKLLNGLGAEATRTPVCHLAAA